MCSYCATYDPRVHRGADGAGMPLSHRFVSAMRYLVLAEPVEEAAEREGVPKLRSMAPRALRRGSRRGLPRVVVLHVEHPSPRGRTCAERVHGGAEAHRKRAREKGIRSAVDRARDESPGIARERVHPRRRRLAVPGAAKVKANGGYRRAWMPARSTMMPGRWKADRPARRRWGRRGKTPLAGYATGREEAAPVGGEGGARGEGRAGSRAGSSPSPKKNETRASRTVPSNHAVVQNLFIHVEVPVCDVFTAVSTSSPADGVRTLSPCFRKSRWRRTPSSTWVVSRRRRRWGRSSPRGIWYARPRWSARGRRRSALDERTPSRRSPRRMRLHRLLDGLADVAQAHVDPRLRIPHSVASRTASGAPSASVHERLRERAVDDPPVDLRAEVELDDVVRVDDGGVPAVGGPVRGDVVLRIPWGTRCRPRGRAPRMSARTSPPASRTRR